jgi:hypothetical protein
MEADLGVVDDLGACRVPAASVQRNLAQPAADAAHLVMEQQDWVLLLEEENIQELLLEEALHPVLYKDYHRAGTCSEVSAQLVSLEQRDPVVPGGQVPSGSEGHGPPSS